MINTTAAYISNTERFIIAHDSQQLIFILDNARVNVLIYEKHLYIAIVINQY